MLVNLGAVHRRVLVQAGGMREHRFTTVHVDAVPRAVEVEASTIEVILPPRTRVGLQLGMQRFVGEPTLTAPW